MRFPTRITGILMLLVLAMFQLHAQKSSPSSVIDSILLALKTDQVMNAQRKSDIADSAFLLARKNGLICQQINARISQANFLDNLGRPDSALAQLYWVNSQWKGQCDSLQFMRLYINLTSIFLTLNELDRIDSLADITMGIWNPQWNDTETKLGVLVNWAIAHAFRGNFEKADSIFHISYREAKLNQNLPYMQTVLNNLGGLKGAIGDLDSAFYYINEAVKFAKSTGDVENQMISLVNLSNIELKRNKYGQAIILLDSAYALAESVKNLDIQVSTLLSRAVVYASKGDHKRSYDVILEYIKRKEELLDETRIKAVNEMMEKYESEKKARQIQQLEVEKLDANLRNERIRNARNRYLFIGAGIFLLSLALLNRLQYTRKSRAAIQKEKDISEGLLLNILPASVADELKIKGSAEAKQFPEATIIFSDFKEFTTIASGLSPAELVEELNVCFKAFDEIMGRYGLEKIKTIGDAYMSAAALPDTNKAGAIDAVYAALDMQAFVTGRKMERDNMNLPAFEMRIGLHSGPVIAGIVGVKKFQYDIWGDTVNIASRVETNGEVGKVNISEATYSLVKNTPDLTFTPRGLIHAKGKGDIEMYFVGRAA